MRYLYGLYSTAWCGRNATHKLPGRKKPLAQAMGPHARPPTRYVDKKKTARHEPGGYLFTCRFLLRGQLSYGLIVFLAVPETVAVVG